MVCQKKLLKYFDSLKHIVKSVRDDYIACFDFKADRWYHLGEAAEREQGGDEDEDEDQGTFDDEPYICNGLHKGGIETPANRLIHIDTEAEYSEKVVIQERFLDAEYIKTCQTKDSPVVLWPVVPLR